MHNIDFKRLGSALFKTIKDLSILAAIILLIAFIIAKVPLWGILTIAFLALFACIVRFNYEEQATKARLEQLKKNFLSR